MYGGLLLPSSFSVSPQAPISIFNVTYYSGCSPECKQENVFTTKKRRTTKEENVKNYKKNFVILRAFMVMLFLSAVKEQNHE